MKFALPSKSNLISLLRSSSLVAAGLVIGAGLGIFSYRTYLARQAAAAQKKADSSAAAIADKRDIAQITKRVQSLYTNYPQPGGSSVTKVYFSPDFLAQLRLNPPTTDPVYCAPNKPDRVTYDQPKLNSDKRTGAVLVHTFHGNTEIPITITVRRSDSLIDSIDCPAS